MLNFHFSEKGLGLVFPLHFVFDFSKKCFLWSSRFDKWRKIEDKNLDILRTKTAFELKQKAFFIIFKGLSVAKDCVRPESAPLKKIKLKNVKETE